MPGGAAEDIPVCLVLGTASVMAIEKKKKKTPENGMWLLKWRRNKQKTGQTRYPSYERKNKREKTAKGAQSPPVSCNSSQMH